MVGGCVSAHGMGSLHDVINTETPQDIINTERYLQVLEQDSLPSTQCLIWGRTRLFQQDNAKPLSECITTVWRRSRRVQVLNWNACSPDLLAIESSETVEQLKSCISQE